MVRFTWTMFVVVAAAVVLAGCSQNSSAGLGTVPVTGTVTLSGAPVEGAMVLFRPTAGDRAASGLTDASGKFTLMTLNPGDGALPGSYNVAITKTEAPAQAAGMSEEEATAAHFANPDAVAEAPEDLLPAQYKDAAKSGLKADVKESGVNEFTFDLKP